MLISHDIVQYKELICVIGLIELCISNRKSCSSVSYNLRDLV